MNYNGDIKKKWCPFVKIGEDAARFGIWHNRNFKCLADGCMAWDNIDQECSFIKKAFRP